MEKRIKVIDVKGKTIGGDNPLICMPIVAKNYDDLMIEAGIMLAQKPDLVEWRVDFYEGVNDVNSLLFALEKLREILIDFPLIFTLRIDIEGGFRTLDPDYRLNLIKEALRTTKIDMVDFELINGEDKIKDILDTAKQYDVYTILSNHDFKRTPAKDEIIRRLTKAQDLGGDIAKIAVMANSISDLLELLEATYIMKESHAKVPLVTMAMSGKGLLSRLAGGIFGSSITFAAGRNVSAPGQISVEDLRNVLDVIERNMG